MSSFLARAIFRLRAMISTLVAQLRTAWWRLLGMKVGHETLLPKI